MFEQELDSVEEALLQLSEEILPEDASDEQVDEFTDYLFEVIGEMIVDGEIEEMPSDEATEDDKKKWIDASLAQIKERVNGDKNSSDQNR